MSCHVSCKETGSQNWIIDMPPCLHEGFYIDILIYHFYNILMLNKASMPCVSLRDMMSPVLPAPTFTCWLASPRPAVAGDLFVLSLFSALIHLDVSIQYVTGSVLTPSGDVGRSSVSQMEISNCVRGQEPLLINWLINQISCWRTQRHYSWSFHAIVFFIASRLCVFVCDHIDILFV